MLYYCFKKLGILNGKVNVCTEVTESITNVPLRKSMQFYQYQGSKYRSNVLHILVVRVIAQKRPNKILQCIRLLLRVPTVAATNDHLYTKVSESTSRCLLHLLPCSVPLNCFNQPVVLFRRPTTPCDGGSHLCEPAFTTIFVVSVWDMLCNRTPFCRRITIRILCGPDVSFRVKNIRSKLHLVERQNEVDYLRPLSMICVLWKTYKN
jgi:hypothetical protein